MCILIRADNGHIPVNGTKIYARALPGRKQVLVYQMNVGQIGNAATAMILPLPTSRVDDGGIVWVNLHDYKTFFADLARAFEYPMDKMSTRSFGAGTLAKTVLPVHKVGDYIASFVPTYLDFPRLSPQFRLPSIVADAFPAYREGHGFAVFQLSADKALEQEEKPRIAGGSYVGSQLTSQYTPGASLMPHTDAPQADLTQIQPMAFVFDSALPDMHIHLPTVHFHGGEVHATDVFDHTFYIQGADCDGFGIPANYPLKEKLDRNQLGGMAGYMDLDGVTWKIDVHGRRANQDTLIRPGGYVSPVFLGD